MELLGHLSDWLMSNPCISLLSYCDFIFSFIFFGHFSSTFFFFTFFFVYLLISCHVPSVPLRNFLFSFCSVLFLFCFSCFSSWPHPCEWQFFPFFSSFRVPSQCLHTFHFCFNALYHSPVFLLYSTSFILFSLILCQTLLVCQSPFCVMFFSSVFLYSSLYFLCSLGFPIHKSPPHLFILFMLGKYIKS